MGEGQDLSDWVECCGEGPYVNFGMRRPLSKAHRDTIKRSTSDSKVTISKPLALKFKKQVVRDASVGSMVLCPVCGRRFVKKSYQHSFCRNKGRSNCKDKYWNTVIPERQDRIY